MSELQRGATPRSLVERLRSRAWEDRQHRRLREEAAAEIERLSALSERKLTVEIPDGWQIVPKKPTPDMAGEARRVRVNLQFGNQGMSGPISPFEAAEIYGAMLEAAPRLVSVKEFTLSNRETTDTEDGA